MEIKELLLFTDNLEEQKVFYSDVLGLQSAGHFSDSEISFKIGNSKLRFIKSFRNTHYHFALNIYSNQEEEALLWLKKRVPILKNKDDEIQDFSSWNARAVYFYDADKNIVEFIARKNMNQTSSGIFGSNSLLEISEIGLPGNSIEDIYKKLNEEIGLTIYSGNFETFCAIGDERGLIVSIDENKKGWFPVNDAAFPSDFHAEILHEDKTYTIKYINKNLLISQNN